MRISDWSSDVCSSDLLPSSLAHRMYWWVSAALRRRILVDYSSVDPMSLDGALQDATKRAIASQNPRESTGERAKNLVVRLAETGALTISFLTCCLKQQKLPLFVAGLSRLSGVEARTVWRIFSDKGGESFAVLCRAIDMDRSDFASLFLLLTEARVGQHVRPAAFLTDILGLYDAVSVVNARAALTYCQRAAAFQKALAAMSGAGHGAAGEGEDEQGLRGR